MKANPQSKEVSWTLKKQQAITMDQFRRRHQLKSLNKRFSNESF